MLFFKIPYYIASACQLALALEKPQSLIGYLVGKPVELRFSEGFSFFTTQPADGLIVKETIVDDSYGIRGLVKPQIIIDVGGALGDSAIFSAFLHPKAKVIVFEPNPESFQLLQKNIDVNKVKNIEAHQLAVSTQAKLKFFVSAQNVRSSIVKDDLTTQEITVKGTKLERYIGPKDVVSLLKIDCEGGEMDVLASIKDEQFLRIKRIILEYHRHLIPEQDQLIKNFLKKKGFHVTQKADPYNADIGYIYADRV